VTIKNNGLRRNWLKFSKISHREWPVRRRIGYQRLILWTLCFLNISNLYSQQTIQVLGDLSKASDSCKCRHLLNRDRKAVPVDLSRHRWQNILRDNYKNKGELEKKMIENYFWKCGDYELTDTEFRRIVPFIQGQWSLVMDSTIFFVNEEPYISKRINFYGHPMYDFVFGYGWVIADKRGRWVGFRDRYDFNKAPLWGKRRRSLIAEIATRIMRLYAHKTKPFNIYYGMLPPGRY
jgi:hypothetical protein